MKEVPCRVLPERFSDKEKEAHKLEDRVYFPTMSAICLWHQQIMAEAVTRILVL